MPKTVERILKTGDIAKIIILEKDNSKIKRFKVEIVDKSKKIKQTFEVPSEFQVNNTTIKLEKGNRRGEYKEFDFRIKLKPDNSKEFTPTHAHLLLEFYTKLKNKKKIKKKPIGDHLFKMIEDVYNGVPAKDVIKNHKKDIKQINKTPGMDAEIFLYALELIFIQEDLNYPPDKKNSKGKHYEGRDKTFSLFKKVKNGKTPIEALMEADLRIKLDPNKFSLNINNLIEILVGVYNNENNVIEALEKLGIKIGS